MKEKPILFSAPMVRAILAGTKTQTRRTLKHEPPHDHSSLIVEHIHPTVFRRGEECPGVETFGVTTADGNWCLPCPYGQPGDRLWVREAFIHEPADYCWEASVSIPCRPATTVYRADFEGDSRGAGWKPSIHMPRSLSRITLEITDIRVERLQDISEADAIAEGVNRFPGCTQQDDTAAFNRIGPVDNDSFPIARYAALWESINGHGAWDANPFVWCVSFKRLDEVSQ